MDAPKRQRGRPELPEDERTKTRSVRLNDARWDKLKRLGMDWLARAIDRAKEPTESK
jgi:hypothetical protein